MKYIDHKGKERRVSDKRFQEYLNKWCNEPKWLEFRMKIFKFPKEDLIMHPESYMIVHGKDGVCGSLRQCGLAGGKYLGKYYGAYFDFGPHNETKYFDTPQEAYDYAYNLE